MKLFTTLSLILLLTMNSCILAKRCPVKNPQPEPTDGGDNQEPSVPTDPSEDRVLIDSDITDNVNYQGSDEPPVGYSIPVGFGEIVPAEYRSAISRSANSSSVATLLVGAQFVADHAFIKGLFTNTNHRISQVFSRQVTHLTNIRNWDGEPTDLGRDRYDFDVEIISAQDEKLRAKFSVESSVFDNTDSFFMDSFSFAYNAIVDGEAKVVELSWTRTGTETENFKYNLVTGGQAPETKVITEANLPTLGQTITKDALLAQKGWNKITLATVNRDANLNYIYQVGAQFVNVQLQSLPIFSSLFSIDHAIGIYQQNVDENVTKIRFNIEAGEYLSETANTNYEVTFDKVKREFVVHGWSVMTHDIPLIL